MKHTVSLPGYEIIELLEEDCFSTVYKIKRTDKALADKYFALKVFNIPDQFLYNNLKSEGYSDNDIKKQAEETVKTLVSNSEIFMGNFPNIIKYERVEKGTKKIRICASAYNICAYNINTNP